MGICLPCQHFFVRFTGFTLTLSAPVFSHVMLHIFLPFLRVFVWHEAPSFGVLGDETMRQLKKRTLEHYKKGYQLKRWTNGQHKKGASHKTAQFTHQKSRTHLREALPRKYEALKRQIRPVFCAVGIFIPTDTCNALLRAVLRARALLFLRR